MTYFCGCGRPGCPGLTGCLNYPIQRPAVVPLPVPTLVPVDVGTAARELVQAREALKTFGIIAGDLKDQRDAREEECDALRAHLAGVLRVAQGKVKRQKEARSIVIAAEQFLAQPRHGAPRRRSEQACTSGKGT